VSKCVQGISVQLLKTAGADEKSSWKKFKENFMEDGIHPPSPPLPVVRPRVKKAH